ncbi:MAG: transglycosylase SLT domain-containing protein [Bacteroidota bacterium]
MKFRKPVYPAPPGSRRYLLIPLPPGWARIPKKHLLWSLALFGSHWLASFLRPTAPAPAPQTALPLAQPVAQQAYLLEHIQANIPEWQDFVLQARSVAQRLAIPSSWLMSVMFAESGFRSRVSNYQGSGAVGLIQFMPQTAKELQTSTWALQQMTATEQLTYVEKYLAQVRRRYGPYQSLGDLYLGILYPKARGKDACFRLYGRPSEAYRQNKGLDENRDGQVTVSDIDLRMARLFPEAFAEKMR